MARTIDITARIERVEARAVTVAARADHGPSDITQDDTCCVCARGSVTLRTVSPTAGQRICSQRAYQAGPQASCFVSAPTASPDALRGPPLLSLGTNVPHTSCRGPARTLGVGIACPSCPPPTHRGGAGKAGEGLSLCTRSRVMSGGGLGRGGCRLWP